ncbi:unnamed protein product [Rotaria sordida]|uniref:Uncharacterized protein n=1 Tax=Rotaria sordida TaxID=392033 RepID=A0A814Y5Y9_9BILA|nr:unnamed protein product [Rotaria sordida]
MFTHVIRHCFISCLIRRSLSIVPNNSTVPSSSIRICCIVGSGPAAEHERVRFIRNIHVGKTIGLKELQEFYHIIVLAYGSSVEHNLHISAHTVAKRIIEDIEQSHLTNLHEIKSGGDGLIVLAKSRQIRCISYEDWKKLDAHEINLGHVKGKPREKIINIQKMLELTTS